MNQTKMVTTCLAVFKKKGKKKNNVKLLPGVARRRTDIHYLNDAGNLIKILFIDIYSYLTTIINILVCQPALKISL